MADLLIGIDFGTCYIKVAKWNNKKKRPVRIHLDSNQNNSDYMIPNVIEYQKTEDEKLEKIVGEAALDPFEMDNVVEHIKYHLQKKGWQQFIPSMGRAVDAMEVLQDIFLYLKDTIEEQNGGKEIKSAVITTPVCYSEIQKQRIIHAAKNVGIPVTDVITESVAAVFYIQKYFEENKEKNILIFDFGGATLDMSLFHIERAETEPIISVLASEGMNYGGINLNDDIYDKIFLKKYPELEWVQNHERALIFRKDILHTIEKMKRTVYRDGCVEREWRPDTGEDFVIVLKLELKEFISMLKLEYVDKKIQSILEKLLIQGDLKKEELTNVCIVGGTSRILFFQELLKQYFRKEIFEELEDDEIYGAVSEGAVQYLHLIRENKMIFKNQISYDIGIADYEKKFQRILSKSARFGQKSRIKPAILNDGKMNVYQMFIRNKDLEIEHSGDIIYMGYFEVDISLYSNERNIRFEMYINKKGVLLADFYDGKEKKETLKLIVGC